MFHHCTDPIRFGHFEHLELPRRCIVTWHLLAANSKLVEKFEPSTRCGAGNKEKLSASTRSWLASGFCHDRKSALSLKVGSGNHHRGISFLKKILESWEI